MRIDDIINRYDSQINRSAFVAIYKEDDSISVLHPKKIGVGTILASEDQLQAFTDDRNIPKDKMLIVKSQGKMPIVE